MTVISRTGTTKLSFPTEDKEARVIEREVLAVGINEENDVYLVVFEKTSENVYGHIALYMLDEHYTRVKHESTLHFLSKLREYRFKNVRMAVGKDDIIVIKPSMFGSVYICDNTGQLKYNFVWQPSELDVINKLISISDKNEFILAGFVSHNVDLVIEEGELKLTLTLQKDHTVFGVAFHYITRKIIVLSKLYDFWKDNSYHLHCYSETGELENSMFLCNENRSGVFISITSHPSGPVAVVKEKSIIYI